MDVIYKAINKINGKCYIGWAVNFETRKHRHQNDAKNNKGFYFHKAINKHGWDNFEWSILYEGLDAKEKETYYIEKNKSYENGYNLTKGGDGTTGHKHSEEHKQYMKIAMIGKNKGTKARVGKKHTEETKRKIGNKRKQMCADGLVDTGKGRKMSEEQRSEMSKMRIGVPLIKKRRCYEITHPDGKIEVIVGLKPWCRQHNLHAGNMCSLNKGTLKYYKGFKCRKLN